MSRINCLVVTLCLMLSACVSNAVQKNIVVIDESLPYRPGVCRANEVVDPIAPTSTGSTLTGATTNAVPIGAVAVRPASTVLPSQQIKIEVATPSVHLIPSNSVQYETDSSALPARTWRWPTQRLAQFKEYETQRDAQPLHHLEINAAGPVKAITEGVISEVKNTLAGLMIVLQAAEYRIIYRDLTAVKIKPETKVAAGDTIAMQTAPYRLEIERDNRSIKPLSVLPIYTGE